MENKEKKVDLESMIPKETLKELMKAAGTAASKAVLKTIEEERAKTRKQNADKRYKTTKGMLKSYRREKLILADEAKFTPEEQREWRWAFLEDLVDTMPRDDKKMDDVIPDMENTRRECMYSVWMLENALKLYELEVNAYGRDIDKRRFEELKALYIDDTPATTAELAEMYNVTEPAIYKDIGIAIRIMVVYLFGKP